MGKGATLAIEVRPEEKEPIFLALARAIITEIEKGKLKPGDPLPGTRALSRNLILNRNTVDAAYHELTMQGWLTAESSRGTFVARDLPDFGRELRLVQPAVATADRKRPMLDLSDGAPDPRLVPIATLGQAFRRALSSPSFLVDRAYGDPRGSLALREALSSYLKDERGLAVGADNMLITRGSQMALFLAASALMEPGAAIAVETPGYPLAWGAFRAVDARVVGVPADEGGIDIDALELLARREKRLKAVYVTPHHQYPTTVTLGAARRLRLLELARRHRLVVIEDDYDHEFRFDGRPVLPLAARAEADVPVIYLGSLSKLLAPGLRVGYAIAQPALIRRMADRREVIDRQGDLPLEHALADLITEGAVRRHARKARRVYHARRDRFAALLRERFADVAEFSIPAGGLAVWLRLREETTVSAETWSTNAGRLGLSILPGVRFMMTPTSPPEAFRLGFARLKDDEMIKAVDLLDRSRP
ncbi:MULTISPECIES: PLP-dependent aminotransferase family protein [unclassified Xanthobacter]|uniref:MocR-like pyridoxine biosynthesis transcription factor PdxR n=1 Tax=unclassified Xanthobacter TaxID=2623496 RepID=UPI001F1AFBAF|nr:MULTISPECIES: PLP-dependent aminotransferase family protein [unclassified Xanthobacter]